jgi:hypothetical protein
LSVIGIAKESAMIGLTLILTAIVLHGAVVAVKALLRVLKQPRIEHRTEA